MQARTPENKGINGHRNRTDGIWSWDFKTEQALTDEEAASITFLADLDGVALGDSVIVEDADGSRIGHVTTLTLRPQRLSPAIALCSITLM
ncbi:MULTISPECIES: hypothetical protein [Gordonia]|uniref:hypothetical protein n=1 Tax=Gordonia TaxID=2053 RepID=UPI0005EDA240|nr:hypothetical protein [Gordonia sihwensis]KJR10578.1 hypothetical protein UG54_00900 [Gordonia sihwensis]